jgi:hypothetical protein
MASGGVAGRLVGTAFALLALYGFVVPFVRPRYRKSVD